MARATTSSSKPVERDLRSNVVPTGAYKGEHEFAPDSYGFDEFSLREFYLLCYNAASAGLWAALLIRVVSVSLNHGPEGVFSATQNILRITQSLAAAEVAHSSLGLVRAPISTTIMQVASRFLLVWGIAFFFPGSTGRSPAYISMLVAWSVTEIIRYSYFAHSIAHGQPPSWLTWLRYNTFFVLYPLGISSECWLVWQAVEPMKALVPGLGLEWALYGILGVYVPGSYILFTHMMKQRKKVLSGAGKAPKAKGQGKAKSKKTS